VTLFASVVGGVVGATAANAGAGECAGVATVDRVCANLVHTLAPRIGLVTAVVTAILVLTVIGLSRLAEGSAPR
jgi:phosphate/sulfate permease